MKSMKIKTLYKDEKTTLQKLIITIGSCHMVKYRQIKNCGECGLDVQEVKEPPLWYLRLRKLNKLGI